MVSMMAAAFRSRPRSMIELDAKLINHVSRTARWYARAAPWITVSRAAFRTGLPNRAAAAAFLTVGLPDDFAS